MTEQQEELPQTSPQQSWGSFGIKVLNPSYLFMAFQGTETTRQDTEAHLPTLVTEQSLPVQQASELKSSGFLSCPHSKDQGWRHSHLSNPSNQGRHDQMVLVLSEGIRRGGRGGKMPTDLNQTPVNQMPGDGDITVFLPHSHVSRKGSCLGSLCSILRWAPTFCRLQQETLAVVALPKHGSREILGSCI